MILEFSLIQVTIKIGKSNLTSYWEIGFVLSRHHQASLDFVFPLT